mgnify:CR=1 FL=1
MSDFNDTGDGWKEKQKILIVLAHPDDLGGHGIPVKGQGFADEQILDAQHDHGVFQAPGLPCLLDMPLRLGKLRHVIFGDRVDLFEFDTVFNLFELIDGIAWELSFQNLPQTCDIRR